MKYCEVVRDIASKPGDWSFYDEQFRYIRQSAPDHYPWDNIHWELWLRAVQIFVRVPKSPLIRSPRALGAACRFQKGRVGHFTPGDFAAGAASTTFVSNVAHPTPPVSVHPLIHNAPPLPSPEPNNPTKPVPLLSSPVTPVRVDRLDFLLRGYAPALKQFLIDGFSFGFRIRFMGERRPFESPNLKSAREQPHIVTAKINKERAAGRIAGPFPLPPFSNFRCSPLGIVPKKDPSETFRAHHSRLTIGLL